jgi:hypothetical protein
MRLAQGIEVRAGQVVEFPIEIPLAYNLIPSRLSPCTEAIWKLMAMVRRRLHHDLWVSAFLNVYNENLI